MTSILYIFPIILKPLLKSEQVKSIMKTVSANEFLAKEFNQQSTQA